MKFASAPSEPENSGHRPPGFPIFLARVALNDFFSIGVLRMVEALIFAILFLRLFIGNAIASAVAAFVSTEASLLLLCVATKKALVGSKWVAHHGPGSTSPTSSPRTPFCLVQGDHGILRHCPRQPRPARDGMPDRTNHLHQLLQQCFD